MSKIFRRSRRSIVAVSVLGGLTASAFFAAAADTEPAITAKDESVRVFLQALHDREHYRWADSPVWGMFRASSPFKDSSRVVVKLAADKDGDIRRAEFLERSGHPEIDDLAMAIAQGSGPWAQIPAAAKSEDGSTYVEWTFTPDRRQCAGIRVVPKIEPLDEAVPRLFAQGKESDIWKRVQQTAGKTPDPVLTWYAPQHLKRSLSDRENALTAASALVASGDFGSIEVVRDALRTGSAGSRLAARALAKAGIPVCPLVSANLTRGTLPVREMAVEALRSGSADIECIPGLAVNLSSPSNPPTLRLAALKVLTDTPGEVAESALRAVKDDPLPVIRGAVMLALVKPMAGRSTVFKLIPFLTDPSVEMRAAASAGIVRAGGDEELPQLYKLFREKDPRTYESVAEELGKFSTEPTAQLLGKMVKKDDQRIRLAAASALAVRSDPFARELLLPLAKDADIKVKMTALMATSPEEALRLAMADSPEHGRKIYGRLVSSARRDIAAGWLLSSYPSLPPKERVEVLGEWLASAVTAPNRTRPGAIDLTIGRGL